MPHRHLDPGAPQAGCQVHGAADIAGQDVVRTLDFRQRQLRLQQAVGHLGLADEIAAGGAAALAVHRDHFQFRDPSQQRAHGSIALDHVSQRARRLQQDAGLERAKAQSRRVRVRGQETMDVAGFPGEGLGGGALYQLVVFHQLGGAAAGDADHRRRRLETFDIAPRTGAGGCRQAGVLMHRPAAGLAVRNRDRAAEGFEQLHRGLQGLGCKA